MVPGYLLSHSLCGPWHRTGQWPMFLQAWIQGHMSHSTEACRQSLDLKAVNPVGPLHIPYSILLSPGYSQSTQICFSCARRLGQCAHTVMCKHPVSGHHQDEQFRVKCLGLANPWEGWGPSVLSCKGNCGFFLSFSSSSSFSPLF